MSDEAKQPIEDGGPAFPFMPDGDACRQLGVAPVGDAGMSLRDWFAGQALAGMAGLEWRNTKDVAKITYEYADAMLKAREAKI